MESPVASAVETPSSSQPTLVRGLSLLDSVLLLVSGIIGSSIFLTAKDIAGPLPQPMLFLLVWVIGGVISLFGCVAFAELGSMFPESGGQYVYLREAYGDLVAFLYGWMLFAVANGGTHRGTLRRVGRIHRTSLPHGLARTRRAAACRNHHYARARVRLYSLSPFSLT